MEKYSRGRRGAPAKGVGRGTAARVRIPLSPPVKKHVDHKVNFFYFNTISFLIEFCYLWLYNIIEITKMVKQVKGESLVTPDKNEIIV